MIALLIAFEDKLLEALELGLNEYYEASFSLISELLEEYPTKPEIYLLRAALLDYMMDDLGTNKYENDFFKSIDYAMKYAKPLLQSEREAWGHFILGSAYAYRAFRYGKRNIFLPVLSDITNAVDHIRKALSKDSTIYDAYLPLGIYNYATHKFPKVVRFIMRVGDVEKNKEEGIRQLYLASNKAKYVGDMARFSLGYILMEERRYSEAYDVLNYLYRKYDHSRNVRWMYSKLLRRMGRWSEAEKVYEELLYLILDEREFDKYQVALASYYVAYTKYINRKYDKAYRFAMFSYMTALENSNRKEIRKLLPYIERLLNRIKRRLAGAKN